jgi:phage anti-repressor protein/phage antirepressor YoqD-like protein
VTNNFEQLIPANTASPDRITVSARDLHAALEVKDHFKDWFPRMCDYGFEEGKDFCGFLRESSGGRPARDAEITIEMAKEICMLQRSEKGKQARQYFIQLEKDWNSPEKIMSRALQIANDQIRSLTARVEADAPAVYFANAITGSETNILVRDLAKLLKQNGVDTGERRLYELLRNDGFLIKGGSDYNMPTQRAMEMGLFFVKETPRISKEGSVIDRTTKITPKGQKYFLNRYAAATLEPSKA